MANNTNITNTPSEADSWTGTSIIIAVVVLLLAIGYFLLRGPNTPGTPNTGEGTPGAASQSTTTINNIVPIRNDLGSDVEDDELNGTNGGTTTSPNF